MQKKYLYFSAKHEKTEIKYSGIFFAFRFLNIFMNIVSENIKIEKCHQISFDLLLRNIMIFFLNETRTK